MTAIINIYLRENIDLYIYNMLKKIFKKDGVILFIQNEEDIKLCYFIINNFIKDKTIDEYKKDYLKTKSFNY
tara:strand:- start:323 stop:538 length:216 start_codon:yes stop_codon:yes gene_type:complete